MILSCSYSVPTYHRHIVYTLKGVRQVWACVHPGDIDFHVLQTVSVLGTPFSMEITMHAC